MVSRKRTSTYVRTLALSVPLLVPFLSSCRDRYFVMPTTGMEPTIKREEQFRMTALDPQERLSLKRGDIVVFRMPGKPESLQVRRIVALPGDRVEIKSKNLFVNGERPVEPYVTHSDYLVFEGVTRPEGLVRDQLSPMQVPAGRVFVLGDNRDNSLDSRFFGAVAVDDILGRVDGKN